MAGRVSGTEAVEGVEERSREVVFRNRFISILSTGKSDFEKALSFFSGEGLVVSYYAEDPQRGLVFFRGEMPPPPAPMFDAATVAPLPHSMGMDEVARFAWGWLQTVQYPEYPKNVDYAERGWWVYSRDDHGNVGGYKEALFAVVPVWAEYDTAP